VAFAAFACCARASAAKYPVHYFPTGAPSTASPLGANNYSCKPTAAHPYPVVLIHGLLADMSDNWSTMSPLLADNGYCVFALTYGTLPGEQIVGGLADPTQSAAQIGTFVQGVLAATGATKVDLVGHSEGTVTPRYWMEFLGGAKYVNRYVMLAPLWNGTAFYGAAAFEQIAGGYNALLPSLINAVVGIGCPSCTDLLTGSPFMNALNAAGQALPGVSYTDIVTRYDELVQPYTSGILVAPGVENIVLQDQCALDASEHATVAFDPVAAQDVLNALDPAAAEPVPCVPVLPFVGSPVPPSFPADLEG
jgi:triacylglycerol esterase/lipase EstA (alpha/beta hydrolase family)